MRLLFAHDHRFCRGPAGEVYSAGSFPASAWDRFLEHFDQVKVIARDGGAVSANPGLARSDREGVEFEFVPSLASLRQLLVTSPALESRMCSAVESADAVVARLPSEIGLLALKHARRLDKPIAVEVVGCAWDSYWNTGVRGARLYAPLAYLRTRGAVARAQMALYVTSQWLQRRYPMAGPAAVASNVALEPTDEAVEAHRQTRLAALAAGKRPVLGTIGTLRVRYKGIQTVFAALARLRSSGLDLHYRILGPGEPDSWQRMASTLGVSDLVHFDGTRSAGKDVDDWLDEIDIYLQPSFTEGLPRGMIEAMSRGAACVGSTAGGIPELLPPERLHKAGDAGALARIIRRMAGDPAAIAGASEADRQTARQFDPDLLTKTRSEFYAQLRNQAEKVRSSR